jgi:hypothetical protein
MKRSGIISLSSLLVALLAVGCTNPFAPKLEPNLSPSNSVLGDQRTVPGVFQNVQYAFTYRDTLIYGNVLHSDFQFRYYNPDRGADVVFNRDEEMRITYNLFHSAEQLDLTWNDYISQDGDSLRMNVTRSYTMKIVLPPNETFRVDGRAQLKLIRNSPNDVWLIRTWYDESNS